MFDVLDIWEDMKKNAKRMVIKLLLKNEKISGMLSKKMRTKIERQIKILNNDLGRLNAEEQILYELLATVNNTEFDAYLERASSKIDIELNDTNDEYLEEKLEDINDYLDLFDDELFDLYIKLEEDKSKFINEFTIKRAISLQEVGIIEINEENERFLTKDEKISYEESNEIRRNKIGLLNENSENMQKVLEIQRKQHTLKRRRLIKLKELHRGQIIQKSHSPS